jgi:hypothetical protein
MLRARAAESGVEMLAFAAAENTIAVQQWLRLNWGAHADLSDHSHPWRAAALDEESPPFKLAETQAALQEAVTRFRVCTGRDGLVLARAVIAEKYGVEIADAALAPLTAISADAWDIEAMLADTAPVPEPTDAQRRAARRSNVDWLLSSPELGDLGDRLQVLLAAWRLNGADQYAPAVSAALAAVQGSVEDALKRTEPTELETVRELVQVALESWAEAYEVGITFAVVLGPRT